MTKKQKRKYKRGPFIILLLVILIVLVAVWYFFFREKQVAVTVVSKIDGYNYYLDSNETRIYKKYYKELEAELKDSKVDEEKYVEIISKLFSIDFYTLTNKLTNKDVGGIQFIHSNLQESFATNASSSLYKYVKSNLSGNRKQKLPEVNKVEVTDIEKVKYKNNDYKDDSSYQVTLEIGYVKDYDYPKKVTLTMIHEENKLSIVEVK